MSRGVATQIPSATERLRRTISTEHSSNSFPLIIYNRSAILLSII